MKNRTWKKAAACFLSAALTFSAFGAPVLSVHAAGLPDTSQFVTKEQLKNFDTNDTTGSNPAAKVYFGNNNQKWWIAGSQNNDSLVLFAASPLQTDVQFYEDKNNHNYSYEANTGYGTTAGTIEVYANHYGASAVRQTLKGLETSYFTSAEQGMMKNTTVYTDDSKNTSTSVYSTTDKLYLAYGGQEYGDDITVGLNSSSSLNDGLRVDRSYWGNSAFWLRTPRNYAALLNKSENSLIAQPVTGRIGSFTVNSFFTVVPAFELNLSSVSFASTAPPASSDGTLTTTANEFTMRRSTSVNIGTASISKSKESVAVTGAKENTYLVVQNSVGAWAKKVAGTDVVFAEEVSMNGTDKLSSFENCKVWLETTGDDRITYAAEATLSTSDGKNIKVNAGQNMTITNNIQIGVTGAIQDIKVKANDGYRFPENYGSGLTLKDLTLTRVSATEMKLSGTPSTDTYIQLPDIAAIPKAATPNVSASSTASSITLKVTNYNTQFGDIQYSTDGGTSWQTTTGTDIAFTELRSSTNITILVRFMGNGTEYAESETATVNASTSQASYTISIPTTATADGTNQDIAVNTDKPFDLGYGGTVNVTVSSGIASGNLTLTRQGASNTITSAMYVGSSPFTDTSQNVATFKSKTDNSVAISFKKPEGTIPAGTYSGTVTFAISYSEP